MRKLLFLIALVCVLASSAAAQVAVTPIPWLKPHWTNRSGFPCSGCLLYAYQAGTLIAQATYSDALGVSANPQPVVLDAYGEAWVFLLANAYKLQLTTPGGVVIFTIDNVTSGSSIFAGNGTYSGLNTFNGATVFNGSVTMNVGFTSSGPNNLSGGGSLGGTYSGSPIFSGTPNFSNGFLATTGIFSGQITSSLAIGTAPFIITSTTEVLNLNANLLEGCDWPSPCPIGSTTPNTAVFSTLKANTSFTLNGSTPQTGIQGTDSKLLTASTIAGTGANVCTDALGGITTSGCASGFSLISLGKNSSVCSTTGAAGNTCTTIVAIAPVQPDTLYIANCTGVTPTQYPFIIGVSKAVGSITVTISNGSAGQAQISTFAELDCSAIHP
jgi:hypothetical protein